VNYLIVAFVTASFVFSTYFSSQIFAQTLPDIVINEFSSNNGTDWVELYNPTDDMIDLSSYFLTDGASHKKTFTCILLPQGFISVDWDSSLNNNGDIIKLNKDNDVIDCVAYGDGDGNLCTGQITVDLQKLSPEDFASRENDGGIWKIVMSSTKGTSNVGDGKGENSCVVPTEILTPTPAPIATPTTEPSQNFDNLYISEVMVAPNTGEKEWVELYNDNDFSVTLSDWYIDDIADSGSLPKEISITIGSKMYAFVELSSSVFNNSGDSVRLLDFEENIKSVFSYDHSEKGKTWGWSELKNDIFCLQLPSQNTQNNACTQEQPSTKSTQTSSEATVGSLKTTASARSSKSSTSNSSLKSYAIAVTPPTIFKEDTVESEQSVLSATTSQIDPHASPGYLPLLAASYSLLSIGSLVTKMIYS